MKFTISTCIRSLTLLVAGTLAFTLAAHGQTFSVLHSFKGGADGAGPYAGLIGDAAGNLYGTTVHGGAYRFGTVFKVTNTGSKEAVLYSFTGGADGARPYGGLVRDAAGNIYGTTNNGGDLSCGGFGCGVVFKLDTAGKETVLHTFSGNPDGRNPHAGLILDTAGNFYGTTVVDGSRCCGTVFKLDAAGNETVLYSFGGYGDGRYPYAGLIRDAAGNLYGTTTSAYYYSGDGTVYKIDPAGVETILHRFSGSPDGQIPYAGLARDAQGNLYGTTETGGAFYSYGIVFKVDTSDTESVLYTFTGGADGGRPYAGLILDPAGNLYGTTTFGGDTSCDPPNGCGTVFKLDQVGNLTVLHSFTGGADGGQCYGGLVRDAAGNLYGTTSRGGTYGYGVVFKIAP